MLFLIVGGNLQTHLNQIRFFIYLIKDKVNNYKKLRMRKLGNDLNKHACCRHMYTYMIKHMIISTNNANPNIEKVFTK